MRIQLTDSDKRNTTQILASHENCYIPTPEGNNIVQIVGDDGKAIATYTLEAEISYHASYNPYSSKTNKTYNESILIVVMRNNRFDLRQGYWEEYGISFRLKSN